MPLGASFKIDETARVVYLNKICQRLMAIDACTYVCVARRLTRQRRWGCAAARSWRDDTPRKYTARRPKGARAFTHVFVSPKTATMQCIAIAPLMS